MNSSDPLRDFLKQNRPSLQQPADHQHMINNIKKEIFVSSLFRNYFESRGAVTLSMFFLVLALLVTHYNSSLRSLQNSNLNTLSEINLNQPEEDITEIDTLIALGS